MPNTNYYTRFPELPTILDSDFNHHDHFFIFLQLLFVLFVCMRLQTQVQG